MKQVVPFSGFVNTDDAIRFMPLGEHPFLSMVENGKYFGKGGSLISKLGTLDTGTILVEGEQVVGTAKWINKNRIIYFVYSDEGAHFIGYYDLNTQTHVKLCDIIYAGLDPNYYIWHAEVIEDVLWWTDGKFEGYWGDDGERLFNPPFRLNLQRVEDGEYTTIDLQTIDVIKYPSPFSPTWEYFGTITRKSNLLRNKMFQFRVQYVYEDGEESAWSPISRLNTITDSGYINGSYQPKPLDNGIRLTFNTGHQTVTQIKLAVSVNKGQFGVFKTLDKRTESIPNNDNYVLEYFSNTSFSAIPLDARNYDNVPQSSVCFNKLTSEICYTNIIRGFDRLVPDIDVAYPIEELSNYRIASHLLNVNYINTTRFDLEWKDVSGTDLLAIGVGDFFTFQLLINDVPADLSISLNFIVTLARYNAAYAFLNPQDGRNYLLTQMGDLFVTTINAQASLPASGALVGNTYQITLNASNTINGQLPETGLRAFRLQDTHKTLKKGASYKWYIQYYDRANRDGTALTTEAMQVRVPFVTDQDLSSLTYDGAPYRVYPRLTINHYPPSWATHYQILVAKDNGISSFMQTTLTSIQVLDDGNYQLSLQKTYSLANKGATINHQPQKGDIVRFMQVGVEDEDSPAAVDYITNYFECQVLDYEASGGVDNSQAIYVQRFDLSLIDWNGNRGIQVEIYTPSLDSDVESIFEIGEEYQILNANTGLRYHEGNIQNQTATLPAILTLDYGDVYIRQRQLGTGYQYPNNVFFWYCEDPHFSDYYVSNFNSQGRVAIEDVNARNERINLSIHSGKYIRDTNINNLCVFEFGDNTQDYDPQFGDVVRTFVDGKTLKVLQPLKETSVYLNGTYSVNADGNVSSPAFSNKVFGGYRPYEGIFGCSYAGMSVLIPKMGVFYYDMINNEFIYSVNNGQERVSLKKYLKGSLDFLAIAKGENMTCYPFVESEYSKIGLTIKSDLGSKTILFGYDDARFVGEYDFRDVNGYENIGDFLLSFDANLNAYQYNVAGETTFHGESYNCIIGSVANEMPAQMKRFKSITTQSLGRWLIEAYCDTDATYPAQLTRMYNAVLLEGAYFAQYRKNIYSYPSRGEEYSLINGRDIRSYAVINRLTFSPNGSVQSNEISAAVIETEPSELITTS